MSRCDGGVRTSGGSTSVLVLFKPNMYLPKKVDAVSCVFCSRDMRYFVMLVGLVLGGD